MARKPKPHPDLIDGVFYPSSDGEPVGETEWHVCGLFLLRQALEDAFQCCPDVKVPSAMFLYYVEGDPSPRTTPDIMVIKGVGKHFRRSIKTWIENAIPCVIIELTSEKTVAEDLGAKRCLYERLGVAEYFVYDPEGVIQPILRGFRLKRKQYTALALTADGSLLSKELELQLMAENYMLRLQAVRTGKIILTRQESAKQARQQAEQARRQTEQAQHQAEQARRQAEQAQHQAEQARQRTVALKANTARLKALQTKAKGEKKR
jgi:putative restriction endonuclease